MAALVPASLPTATGAPPHDPVAAALDAIRGSPICAGRISHEVTLPAEPARYGPWPDRLHPALRDALHARGVDQLYTHQAEAITAALRGEDVVVVTATASGKSL